jgi:hypothetical protein
VVVKQVSPGEVGLNRSFPRVCLRLLLHDRAEEGRQARSVLAGRAEQSELEERARAMCALPPSSADTEACRAFLVVISVGPPVGVPSSARRPDPGRSLPVPLSLACTLRSLHPCLDPIAPAHPGLYLLRLPSHALPCPAAEWLAPFEAEGAKLLSRIAFVDDLHNS